MESHVRTEQSGEVTRSPGWLPRGRALAEEEFAWRHRILCWLLGLHVPGVLVAAAATGRGELRGAGGASVLAALLAVALAPLPRRVRASAVALGLLTSSGLLVHLTRQGEELHLHILLALAATALYQDWVVYGTAVAYVAVQQVVVLALGNTNAYGHEGAAWVWVVTHLAFGVVGTGVLLLFWRADEIARASADSLAHELHDGDQGVRARLAEADRIRADLIATVSHEFRTPLTGIRGAALTLLKRGERLGPAARAQLLHAVVEQEERLSRLLENMLTAASATAPDPTAEADVGAVAAAVVAQGGRAATPVSVLVEPGCRARMTPQALHQVLANLLDNAVQHGIAGGVPLLAAGQEGGEVWITVTNEGAGIDAVTAGRLFEPFTQLASGPTRDREGLGMGLYVVRRLVEVHGGRVAVRSLDGWVTVEVRVPVACPAQTPVPTALPIA